MAQRMTTEPDRHEGGAPVPAFPEIKSREEAARLAKSLRKDGKSHSEIAESLTVRGWKSRKGGPATPGGVDSLLKYDPKRRSRSSEEPREEVRRKGASAGPALVAGEAEEDRVDVPGGCSRPGASTWCSSGSRPRRQSLFTGMARRRPSGTRWPWSAR